MKGIFILIAMLSIGLLVACELDDPKIAYSSTYPLNGEWAVTYYEETSPGVFEDVGGGYYPLVISNTASNNGDSIWIWDDEHFWDFKIKASANAKSRSFSTEGSASIVPGYGINIVVSGGAVHLKAITTKGAKAVADSIYMQLEFEDDPGFIYHAAGVRRTGFLEDDAYYGF